MNYAERWGEGNGGGRGGGGGLYYSQMPWDETD